MPARSYSISRPSVRPPTFPLRIRPLQNLAPPGRERRARACCRAARRCSRCRRPRNPAPSQAQRPTATAQAQLALAARYGSRPAADHRRPALAHLSGEAGPGRRLPPAQGGQGASPVFSLPPRQLRRPCRLRSRERDAHHPTARRRLARSLRDSRRRPAHHRPRRRRPHPVRARSGSISSPAASSSPATVAPSCSRSRPAT